MFPHLFAIILYFLINIYFKTVLLSDLKQGSNLTMSSTNIYL